MEDSGLFVGNNNEEEQAAAWVIWMLAWKCTATDLRHSLFMKQESI